MRQDISVLMLVVRSSIYKILADLRDLSTEYSEPLQETGKIIRFRMKKRIRFLLSV